MITFLIVLIIVGAIAGFLARLLLPGRDPMSVPMTIGLGIVGGFLGWLLFRKDLEEGALQPAGLIGSIIGALIVLAIYRATRGRSITH